MLSGEKFKAILKQLFSTSGSHIRYLYYDASLKLLISNDNNSMVGGSALGRLGNTALKLGPISRCPALLCSVYFLEPCINKRR